MPHFLRKFLRVFRPLIHKDKKEILKYPEINLDDICGSKLGKGAVKECFRHKQYSDRCVKYADIEFSRQIVREINYFNYLRKKGVQSDCVPKFYGAFRCKDKIGFIQECFLAKEDGGCFDSVCPLAKVANQIELHNKVQQKLDDLKSELITKNIIALDLHGSNIIFVSKNNIHRTVIIDGLGTQEAVPLPQLFRPLGRLKIERNWKRFLRVYPQFSK